MADVHPESVSEDFNIVLIGSFNPAIFHPEWFVRHGLVGESVLDTAKVVVVSRDVTEFALNSIRLYCTDSRLMIAVSNMAHVEPLMDALMGMLKLLPHLPITAVGLNNDAVFKINSEDRWHQIGHTLVPKDPVWNKLCKKPGMQSLSVQSPVEWTHPIVENLSVEPILVPTPHHPAIRVKANLHFPIPSPPPAQPALTETEIVANFAADMWERATHRAQEVANTIFAEIPS